MQKRLLHFLLLIVFASFGASISRAQTLGLLTMTNSAWRYYQEGNQPTNQGTVTWREPNYDDSSWPVGPGAFGHETDAPFAPGVVIRTPLALSNGTAPQTISYYFRTSFDFNQDPVGSELVFSNVIDDGAVVYLNGTQIYRYRIVGSPTYSTLAQGGNPEGQIEITNIVSSPALRQGVNTIAVEVHQSSATSADIVFGMALLGRRAQPVAITKQPQSQVLVTGEDLELSVEATGSYPTFQWFKNGILLVGATGSNFMTRNVTASAGGDFYVVVANSFSRATSQVAVVTVVPDTVSPAPLSAIVEQENPYRVNLSYNDIIVNAFPTGSPHIFRAATNPANYRIGIVGETTSLTVTSAVSNQRIGRLSVSSPFDPAKEYYISFYNLADDRTNVMRWNEQIGVQFRRTANLVHPNQGWQWTAMWASNLPPQWITNDFDPSPSLWAEDPGPFYYELTPYSTCMLPITQIPIGYDTYYFRTKFVVPTNINPAETSLRFTYLVDDGAIIYVNGIEAFRTNMPAGPAEFNTRALAAWEATACRTNVLPATALRGGTNVIAAEVHQFEPLGEDAFFGLSLDAIYIEGLKIPRITYQRLPGDPSALVLAWSGEGWMLEENSAPATNGWSAVVTSGNAYTNTAANRFFRLKKE
jgi:hypothetical protein